MTYSVTMLFTEHTLKLQLYCMSCLCKQHSVFLSVLNIMGTNV